MICPDGFLKKCGTTYASFPAWDSCGRGASLHTTDNKASIPLEQFEASSPMLGEVKRYVKLREAEGVFRERWWLWCMETVWGSTDF